MITIYGHQYCNKCKEAKRLAEEKKLNYEYIDILEDEEIRAKLSADGIVELPYIIKSEQISLDELRKL